MTPQELADELARLAGWKREWGMWHDPTIGDPQTNHPFPIGSLDALEAFRRESIDVVWRWGKVEFRGTVDAMLCYGDPTSLGSKYRVLHGMGPDEWTARASALVAAARENKP